MASLRVLRLVVVVAVAFQAWGALAAAGEPALGETVPLEELLNPDGTLDVDRGFSGSLDPTGWRMVTGGDGAPRFVPDATAASPGPAGPAPQAPASADDNWDGRFFRPGTDGYVYAIAVDGTDVYIGGDFGHVEDLDVSNVARWDGSSWVALGDGTDDTVFALAVSGSVLYASGQFATAGGVTANHIARWDGSSWNALGSGTAGNVYALAVSGSDLYAGGEFTTAGGVTANHIARWDGSSWHTLGSGVSGIWAGNDPYIAALASSGSDLYAGGSFTTAGGVTANCIARWDGSSWHALGSAGAPGVWLGVKALAASGSDLFVGGLVQTATDVVYGVGRWDGSSWQSLGSADGVVNTLAVRGSDLYLGGDFGTVGGVTAINVARWDGSVWNALGAGTSYRVEALAVGGSDLYVGGDFGYAGGVETRGIARWDGSGWHALVTSGKPALGLSSWVDVLAASGGDLYVGGGFTAAGGVAANHIARWDGSSWHALGSGVGGVFPEIHALAVSGSDLYVGGRFTTAGGVTASHIARWDGSSWHVLGSGTDDRVWALAVSDSDLYAGGDFTTAGGVTANRIARWDGSSWHALGSGTDARVRALAVSDSDLFVGGSFTAAGGVTANHIARWDGSSWHALGAGTNGIVDVLAVSGSDLYVGGYFTTAGGVGANHVARWDGSAWHALGSGVGDLSPAVRALAVSGSDLYVGGRFTMAGGVSANNIARWDGSNWYALGTGTNWDAIAVAVSTSGVHVGGHFGAAGGKPSLHFARWFESRHLQVSKSDSDDPVTVGDSFDYTARVTNLDHGLDATGVTLTDTLPGGVALISATPDQGTCGTGDPVVCDLGDIAPRDEVWVTFSVDAVESGTWTNSVSISSDQPDPFPGNNSDNEDTLIVPIAAPAYEDWDAGDLGGWGNGVIGGTLTLETSGGNPGGHIRVEESPGLAPVAAANSGSWVGDYGAGGIASLSVDAKSLSAAGALWVLFAPFDFLGFTPTWYYVLADPLPFDGAWHSYEVVFDPTWSDAQAEAAGWVKSPPDSTFSFADTMRRVAVVAFIGNEDFRIDNVEILDADEDGVNAAVEDAGPNGGDANGDGTPDSVQGDVASLPDAGSGDYVAVEVSGGCSQLHDVDVMPEAALPQPDLAYDYPFGLVEFAAPCSSATVKLYFHGTSFLAPPYRKYGPTTPGVPASTAWYSLTTAVFGSQMVGGVTVATVTLPLVDGLLGDDTGVDGEIVDIGGPAFGAPAGALSAVIGTLEIDPVGPAPAATATGTGVALVNGGLGGAHLSALSLAGGMLSLSAEPLTTQGTFTVGVGTLTDGPGLFTGGSTNGTLAGAMPLRGAFRLCLVSGCATSLPLPLTEGETRGVGLGGGPIVASHAFGVTVTLQGAPWTAGAVTVPTTNGSVARTGFAHGPLSASTTLNHSGVVQLVTPISVETSLGTYEPAFGVLTLHFIPEPGRLLLLAAGAALLAVLGWKKTARR